MLLKQNDEHELEDLDPLNEEFPNEWAILGDSAYTGAEKLDIRRLYIKKQKQQRQEEREQYHAWSKDHVLIENFYGRMLNLWGIMRKTYTYEHHHYDAIFSVLCSLTNYTVLKNPLRNNDGLYYRKMVKKFIEQGKEREHKRKASKEKSKRIAQACKRANEEDNTERDVRRRTE